jgi:tRNA(Ile2)-agmatinylcytidine synthase
VKKIWIGIDDTDSTKGGCTTYTACLLVKRLIDNDFDIIGYPRLVRLNPNIPWKTRGNGAISIQVRKGKGKKIKIGEIGNTNLFCYSEISSEYSDTEKVRSIVQETVDQCAMLDDRNTNSGFVIIKKKPSSTVYENAVKGIVALNEVENILNEKQAIFKGYKNRRGLIGATASISWKSSNDRSYELISYREEEKWGSKRFVDDNSTIKMDKSFLSTFDNYDYKNRHNRLVPSSPCPVLYGIRGDNDKDLIDAKSFIKSEKVDSWVIFESNQGSDDHLQYKKIKDVKPYDSVIIKATVSKTPKTIAGGHVIFSVKDATGKIDCAAYEPTKQFRNIIRELLPGDAVEVYGGVREKPLTINLEKIKVEKLVKKIEKIENPVCPKCGKHMKSKGFNQGYKCIKCGEKSNKPLFKEVKRTLKNGFYEVPVCARRLLSKPLKRIKQP